MAGGQVGHDIAMTIKTGQGWRVVEGVVATGMLVHMRTGLGDGGMAEGTAARTIGGTALQGPGDSGMTGGTGVFVDPGDQIARMATATLGRTGQPGMAGRHVIFVIGVPRRMATGAVAGPADRGAGGSGHQGPGYLGMAGVAPLGFMDTHGPIRFCMAADTGGSCKDIGQIMVHRRSMVQIVGISFWMTGGAIPRSAGGAAGRSATQDPGGLGMTGIASLGFVNSCRSIRLGMTPGAGGGGEDERNIMIGGSMVGEIRGIGGMTARTITGAADRRAPAVWSGFQYPALSKVMAGITFALMEGGIGDQIPAGVMTCFAGAVSGGHYLPGMGCRIPMVVKSRSPVAGGADVRITKPRIPLTMADGTPEQGNRLPNRMAGGATMVALGIARVNGKNSAMAVDGAIGAAAADQGAMIDHVSGRLLPMTIDTIKHLMARRGLGDSNSDGPVIRVDGDLGAIAPGGAVTGSTSCRCLMPILDRVPTLDLAEVAIHSTPFAIGKIPTGIVGNQMAAGVTAMLMVGEVILVANDTFAVGCFGGGGAAEQSTVAGGCQIVTVGAWAGRSRRGITMHFASPDKGRRGGHMATGAVAGNSSLVDTHLDRCDMAMGVGLIIIAVAMQAITPADRGHILPAGRRLEDNITHVGRDMTRGTVAAMHAHGVIGRMFVTPDAKGRVGHIP